MQTIEQDPDWICNHLRQIWSFILKIIKKLLISEWCNCVKNSWSLAWINSAVKNFSIFFKGCFNFFFSNITSKSSNESHITFFGSKWSEDKSALRGDFKLVVKVLQSLFSSLNTGKSNQSFACLIAELFYSDLLSKLSEFLEGVLNKLKRIRKVIFRGLEFQSFEQEDWSSRRVFYLFRHFVQFCKLSQLWLGRYSL